MSEPLIDFCTALGKVNHTMAELFSSGNVALFGRLNAEVKELHAVQTAGGEPLLEAVNEECKILYVNWDMIVKLLRTVEDGEIDAGAQRALNKFLHNMDDAVVNIASALGLV